MTPFFAKPPITATIARGVPAATPQAPATTITDMVEMRFRVTRKVITAKMIVNSTSQAASLSDILWMGAFLLSASSTSLMDLAKDSLVSHLLSPHLEHTRLINRPSENSAPNQLLNSNSLSRYGGLVDESRTFDEISVNRNPFPISNNYSFTGLNSFYSGLDLFPVPPYKGASRNRLFQFDDCRPSLVDRVSLYEL